MKVTSYTCDRCHKVFPLSSTDIQEYHYYVGGPESYIYADYCDDCIPYMFKGLLATYNTEQTQNEKKFEVGTWGFKRRES